MPDVLVCDEPVLMWTGRVMLDGRLTVPANAPGVVVVGGTAGTWHHPGYRTVAARLTEIGLATIVCDLLTPDEQQFDIRTGHLRVDLSFLAHRVSDIVQWIERNEVTRDLPVAYFGSGIGGTAGLLAATNGLELFGLVLNAARADVIDQALSGVPALLLVDDDPEGRRLATAHSPAVDRDHYVVAIEGSTGLMEPESALDSIARFTGDWLRQRVPELASVR